MTQTTTQRTGRGAAPRAFKPVAVGVFTLGALAILTVLGLWLMVQAGPVVATVVPIAALVLAVVCWPCGARRPDADR